MARHLNTVAVGFALARANYGHAAAEVDRLRRENASLNAVLAVLRADNERLRLENTRLLDEQAHHYRAGQAQMAAYMQSVNELIAEQQADQLRELRGYAALDVQRRRGGGV